MISHFIFILFSIMAAFCPISEGICSATQDSEIKMAGSTENGSALYGNAVAISGDYAIVGAYRFQDTQSSTGAAAILNKTGESWVKQVELDPSDGNYPDGFGNAVSIFGDYAVAGASGDDDNGAYSGAAYIFKRNGSAWTKQVKLTASDGAAGDYFGSSVAICEAYAVIGAMRDDNENGSSAGAVYIFKKDSDTWVEQAKLTASDGDHTDCLGASVAVSGNYVLSGAAYGDANESATGAVYVFELENDVWLEKAKLTATDGEKYDYLGRSISISGNYAAIGTADNAVYIVKRDSDTWSELTRLEAFDVAYQDNFGATVSISGNFLVCGSMGDDDNGSSSGSAYIYKREDDAWTQQVKLTAKDARAGDRFGNCVSISGENLIIGASGYTDSDGETAGAVYLYDISKEQDCTTKIKESCISGTHEINQPVTFTVDAENICFSPLYYRWSIHPDYGTDNYDGTRWSCLTDTVYTTENSVTHMFSQPGKYIVVVWVVTTTCPDADGVPIIGWSIDLTEEQCKTRILGTSISGNQTVDTPITLTVNARNQCRENLYYRWSVHPDYGTEAYDGYGWKNMTGTEYTLDNSISYTFNEPGKYIVTVWAVTDTDNVSTKDVPMIGFSLDISENSSSDTYTGDYGGALAVNVGDCYPEPDDWSGSAAGSIAVATASSGVFRAQGVFTVTRAGILFSLNINFTGSISDAGVLQGTFSYTFSGENGFSSNGSGSFDGSISQDSLTIEINGTDTDETGITCHMTGTFKGN